jgi:GT2 family glycosyltransferase
MDWSLCIATLNRREALLATLAHALGQTRPPAEIVVTDASDDWEATRAEAGRLVAAHPGIRLDYAQSTVRSSATQRNDGIARCRTGIVFLLDDDSFLYPTCAEEILRVYAADPDGAVAAVSARLVGEPPPPPGRGAAAGGEGGAAPARKRSGRSGGLARLRKRALATAPGRWFYRHVLMQRMDALFLRYDGPRQRPLPAGLAAALQGAEVASVSFMPGCAMTVRRAVALAEPFDPALRFYAAFEDLDATYRYARHGHVLQARAAHLHHFEAAGGRVRRTKVIVFQLLNMLVFLKRHAARPEDWLRPYRRMLWRRLLGETLKDLLSGRPGLPQARGVLLVMRRWRAVWACDTSALDTWYPGFQKAILDDL